MRNKKDLKTNRSLSKTTITTTEGRNKVSCFALQKYVKLHNTGTLSRASYFTSDRLISIIWFDSKAKNHFGSKTRLMKFVSFSSFEPRQQDISSVTGNTNKNTITYHFMLQLTHTHTRILRAMHIRMYMYIYITPSDGSAVLHNAGQYDPGLRLFWTQCCTYEPPWHRSSLLVAVEALGGSYIRPTECLSCLRSNSLRNNGPHTALSELRVRVRIRIRVRGLGLVSMHHYRRRWFPVKTDVSVKVCAVYITIQCRE